MMGLMLDEVSAIVRGRAAEALGQLGEASEKVVDGLLALAVDGLVDAWVRGKAAEALDQLEEVEKAVEVLLALAVGRRRQTVLLSGWDAVALAPSGAGAGLAQVVKVC